MIMNDNDIYIYIYYMYLPYQQVHKILSAIINQQYPPQQFVDFLHKLLANPM